MIKSPKDFNVLLVYPNLPLMLVPSLAIGLFTRVLKKQLYNVDLFDTTGYISDSSISPKNRVKFLQARNFNYKTDLGIEIKDNLLDDFRNKVNNFHPDIMLFSVVEDSFNITLKMLNCVKDLDIPHLLGGIFPTSAPNLCLEFPDVNIIGLGEGEYTIVNFAEAVRLNLPLDSIPGTWYKDKIGNIHKNPPNKLININESKPDFSLFSDDRFYRPMGGKIFKTFPIETYRGCPYSCTFCNSPMQVSFAKNNGQGHFLRRKNINTIKNEIEELVDKYSPEFLYFIDDSFTVRPKLEMELFCDMYKKFYIPFWFNTRPESCTTNILDRLKESGCYRISFGIECGNEEYRKNILNRHITNEKLLYHFKLIKDSGIAFSINLIIGFPGETRELIMDTIDLVCKIDGYDTITVSMFTPYHGTKLREIAVNNGWLNSKVITTHTTSQSMLDMPYPYVSKEDLDGLMKTFVLYCYFPKSEWDQIRRSEINDELGNEIFEHYSKIYKTNFLKSTQDDKKNVVGSLGCKSNYKDSIKC